MYAVSRHYSRFVCVSMGVIGLSRFGGNVTAQEKKEITLFLAIFNRILVEENFTVFYITQSLSSISFCSQIADLAVFTIQTLDIFINMWMKILLANCLTYVWQASVRNVIKTFFDLLAVPLFSGEMCPWFPVLCFPYTMGIPLWIAQSGLTWNVKGIIGRKTSICCCRIYSHFVCHLLV